MKRNSSRLISFCFLAGLGLQPLMNTHVFAAPKRVPKLSTKKQYKRISKKTHIYTLHHKKFHRTLQERILSAAYKPDETLKESGTASWYGGSFYHSRTFSGQRLTKTGLTAAHPTLPMGTKVLVRSEDTGNSVIVTINDRGPFIGDRIIDLSQAAAAKIGMIKKGTAQVTVTPLHIVEVAQAPG